MPENQSVLSFKNVNECPIRFYADFESIKDLSLQFKSKNCNTDFNDGDVGASFKITLISDIPISVPHKIVESHYVYEFIDKGLNSNDEFVKQIQDSSFHACADTRELPGPTARVLSPRTTRGRPRESNSRRAAAAPPGSAAGRLRRQPAAGA
jgi:hypothetical protein